MYSTKTNDESSQNKFNAFKASEKRYKYYHGKKTDFSGLIDLTKEINYPFISESVIKCPKTGNTFKCFKFEEPSGLIVIKNYTSPER